MKRGKECKTETSDRILYVKEINGILYGILELNRRIFYFDDKVKNITNE